MCDSTEELYEECNALGYNSSGGAQASCFFSLVPGRYLVLLIDSVVKDGRIAAKDGRMKPKREFSDIQFVENVFQKHACFIILQHFYRTYYCLLTHISKR